MHELRTITVSDSDFYKKVIDKYQKGKRNPFRFPMMIFYKHAGCVLSQKINIDILLQLYLSNWKIVRSLIIKSVQNMERLFSWLSTGKLIPEFMVKRAVPRSVQSANKMFTLIQHETASRLLPAGQMPVKSLSLVRARPETPGRYDRVFKSETSSFSQGQGNQEIVRSLTLGTSHKQSRRLMRRLRGWKENIREYPPGLEHKSPAILPQVNSLLNNRSDKTFQNLTTVNKPLIKHYHYNFALDGTNSITPHRRTPFKAESEDIYFYHQTKIDQEIKEIKKIVVETKDAVKEKSLSSYSPMDIEIKRHLDLSRLTDQVYQMLERKIEIERERRGLYR